MADFPTGNVNLTMFIVEQPYLFTHPIASELNPNIISVTNFGAVTKIICDDSSITQEDWLAIQIKPDLVF